jgi:hypothetical protein
VLKLPTNQQTGHRVGVLDRAAATIPACIHGNTQAGARQLDDGWDRLHGLACDLLP